MNSFDSCKILHIDLEFQTFTIEVLGQEYLKAFIGGRGIGSYLLYRDTRKGIDPMGPENILIFAPGLLCGTNAPTAGRTTVLGKSPATGLFMKANMGGHWGPALKFSGYDILVLHGNSKEWINIIITSDDVYFEDAKSYLGLSVVDTTEKLKENHPQHRDLSVVCIGQAAENKVVYAGVFCSTYHTAGRGGLGTVLAAKKVKAIGCEGQNRLTLHDQQLFLELTAKSRKRIANIERCKTYKELGTAGNIFGLNETNTLPVRNFQKGSMENVYEITGQAIQDKGHFLRYESCYGCTISCKRYTKTINDYLGSESGGPEYETIAAFGAGCDVPNTDASLRANDLCNQYGMDSISASACIQWAMECAEKGVLPKTFIDPMSGKTYNLAFGDAEAMLILIDMIAFRRGLGDLLADGVRKAAKRVGGDSWKWAVEAKGLEQSRVETRNAKGYALSFATNPRGPDHLYGQCMAEFGLSEEMRNIIEQITGDKKYAVSSSTEMKPEIVEWHENAFTMTDALGLCSRATLSTYAILPEDMYNFLVSASGLEMTFEEFEKAAQRVIILERSFNMREGVRRESDVLPWRIMNETIETHDRKGLAINSMDELNSMLDKYYELRGWDESGLPMESTLEHYDLQNLIKEEDFSQ